MASGVDVGVELARLERRIAELERNRTFRNVSIDGTALPVYDDDGVLRQLIGQQADGTYTTVDRGAPPPPMPSMPVVEAVRGGLVVRHDGLTVDGSAWPFDSSHIEVHAAQVVLYEPTDATQVHVFPITGRSAEALLTLEAGVAWFVRFVAVNTSGVESPATPPVAGTPEAALTEAEIAAMQDGVDAANTAAADAAAAAAAAQADADAASTAASGAQQTATNAAQAAAAAEQAALDAAGVAADKAVVLYGTVEPPVEYRNDRTLWIDETAGANTPRRWDGAVWLAVTDKAATDAAAAAAAAEDTAAQAAADAAAATTAANNAAADAATAAQQAATAQSIAQSAESIANSAQADVTAVTSRVDTAEGDITAVETRVTSAEGSLATVDGRVDGLDSTVQSQESRLTTAEGGLVTVDGRVDTAEATISTHTTRLDDAEGTIADIVTVQIPGKSSTTYATTNPGTTPNNLGDTWFVWSSVGGSILSVWQGNGGTSWTKRMVDGATLTNLDAGSITVGVLAAARIAAGAIDTTKIATVGLDAAVIKFGTMSGDRIEANTITADKIDLDTLTGKTLTGAIVQTAAAGRRVVVTTRADGAGQEAGWVEMHTASPVADPDAPGGLWADDTTSGSDYWQTVNLVAPSFAGLPGVAAYVGLSAYKRGDGTATSVATLAADDITFSTDVTAGSRVDINHETTTVHGDLVVQGNQTAPFHFGDIVVNTDASGAAVVNHGYTEKPALVFAQAVSHIGNPFFCVTPPPDVGATSFTVYLRNHDGAALGGVSRTIAWIAIPQQP